MQGSRVTTGVGTGRTRSVLKELTFLRLWSGATASGLATWTRAFVLGLGVLDRTLTAWAPGLVLAARTLGFLAAVAVGGVLSDRYSRRAVVLWAGLAAAAGSPLIAAGVGRSVWLMIVAAVIVGLRTGRLPASLPGADRRGRRRRAPAAGQHGDDAGGTCHHSGRAGTRHAAQRIPGYDGASSWYWSAVAGRRARISARAARGSGRASARRLGRRIRRRGSRGPPASVVPGRVGRVDSSHRHRLCRDRG
ncbi:MFS family permease [Actinopolymorpha pittospori]|uniref:MFS family permease n=1 Tax=Actinopolymorpha pittospori TaxID=648752 RepID=A0A927MNR8_9ACTN|nr:MFS family permease [Actinopolymorpha pittospori]